MPVYFKLTLRKVKAFQNLKIGTSYAMLYIPIF